MNSFYFTVEAEEKLYSLLQYFLSLHEADEIFDAIFDYEYTSEDIIFMLEEYRSDNQ
jgi:hypothetical protein